MRAISAMQKSGVIVSAMGQDIPQRVLSEPVSVPWVAIRKTVNATAYHYDFKDTASAGARTPDWHASASCDC